MIYTLTMNPAVDKTAELDVLQCGELNRLQNVVLDAGGKGINVSKTIKAFNGESVAYGVIAGNTGAFIQSEMDRLEIKHHFVTIEGNTRTNLKVLDKNKVLTELNESGPAVSDEDLERVSEELCNVLHTGDMVIISGSVPKGVPTNFYANLCMKVKEKGADVILDADGPLFKDGVKSIPTAIKPNRFELCQYFEEETMEDARIVELARKFIDQGIKLVAVSMGSDGALFVTKEEAYRIPALKIDAHSAVGAGDAMVAAIGYAIHEKYDLNKLMRFAVAASAGAVCTEGTKPAELELVKQLEKQVQCVKMEE